MWLESAVAYFKGLFRRLPEGLRDTTKTDNQNRPNGYRPTFELASYRMRGVSLPFYRHTRSTTEQTRSRALPVPMKNAPGSNKGPKAG